MILSIYHLIFIFQLQTQFQDNQTDNHDDLSYKTEENRLDLLN